MQEGVQRETSSFRVRVFAMPRFSPQMCFASSSLNSGRRTNATVSVATLHAYLIIHTELKSLLCDLESVKN